MDGRVSNGQMMGRTVSRTKLISTYLVSNLVGGVGDNYYYYSY